MWIIHLLLFRPFRRGSLPPMFAVLASDLINRRLRKTRGVRRRAFASQSARPAAFCVALSLLLGCGAEPKESSRSAEETGTVSGAAEEEVAGSDGSDGEADSEAESEPVEVTAEENWDLVVSFCNEVGGKLGSVSAVDCISRKLVATGRSSMEGRPLVRRDYRPSGERESLGKVLLIGGIHGDEYSSVSIVFKWLRQLDRSYDGEFHWRFLPVTNPDGLLRRPSQRMNSRGVDLNRNFPTDNWKEESDDYWVRRTSRNPRRYPGSAPLSESESEFIESQMKSFKPDIVVSIHAPLEVVDFDGSQTPPDKLGSLYLRRMGTFPGSLGRYGSEDLGIPVLTLELPSAGIMPTEQEQLEIWKDLYDYLERSLRDGSALPSTAD